MKKSKLIIPKSDVALALAPGFAPMKGVTLENFDQISFPVLATPKFDGIRCLTREPLIRDLFGTNSLDILTYALKPVPNAFVRMTLRQYNLANLDGELVCYGSDGKMVPYNPTQSSLMSVDGQPNFKFHVFDIIDYAPYWERQECLLAQANDITNEQKYPRIHFVKPVTIPDARHLTAYEEACISQGFEGVIVRSIDGPYKCGRATFKEGYMYKIKRFKDAEATVIGFEELQRNTNEQTTNEHGKTERSDKKDGKVPGQTLGALCCSGHNGQCFKIGSGFTDSERAEIWGNQDHYKLRTVKYKYQEHGVKVAPRSPIFLGWRDGRDM